MHTYNLRSRINSPAATNGRGTPGGSNTPTTRVLQLATTRSQQSSVALQLDHVIGTTTKSPAGLASCTTNNSFAYCAGSVAVLAQFDTTGVVTHRYYRARPAAVPLNPTSSVYTTPTSTPTRKRRPLVTPRKELDGSGAARALLEDDSARTWTARERIKSVKSVALSSNGRFLAIGETGYNPRVLLFSTARDASAETPLSIINEHTWGVRNVAFSPDGRYLATLGESNDGFLFVWAVNQRSGAVRLCATNKCTTNVCHMVWCGDNLITVGTRHVKIWQLPSTEKTSPTKAARLRNLVEASPAANPVPLYGRNCLLGDLADLTFTCSVAISEFVALVCTDIGSLCLVDVSKNPAELISLDYNLGSARAVGFRQNPQRLVWAGGGGDVDEIDFSHLTQDSASQGLRALQSRQTYTRASSTALLEKPRRSTLRQSLGLCQLTKAGALAVACLAKHTICIDAESNLVISDAESESPSLPQNTRSSHNEPVQGVQALAPDAGLGAFFTWSKTGEVRFWNDNAQLLRVEQIDLDEGSDASDAANNELKVLRYSHRGMFVSGDRFGVLKLTLCDGWTLLNMARAHSTEVNDICIDPGANYVATCSRDRMVQIFQHSDNGLSLIQTTDDHIAAVNQLAFSHDGNTLLSCSADRTIVVREKVSRDDGAEVQIAFLQIRIITIKASPLSMCLSPTADGLLYVSTLDKHVIKINFMVGTVLESFKVTDNDSDDHAVLNSIEVIESNRNGVTRPLLIGCSSTDKSVRVYDLQKQSMLCKESAHTEGVSDVALFENSQNHNLLGNYAFVSTGYDSTIMLWTVIANTQLALTPALELTQEQSFLTDETDNVPVKPSPATLPPLRRMLTKLDIAEFVKNSSTGSPSIRDPSPARLKRMGSKPVLSSSTNNKGDENVPVSQRRRASADGKAKDERRSPSPPAYATQRHKKPAPRGQVTKDFFTRQSEWLRRSPSPQNTPSGTISRLDPKAGKMRLRRPPSVPSDLYSRARAQERRPSTVVISNESAALALATEQTCRTLKTYKKSLQTARDPGDLAEIELQLEAVLTLVRNSKKQTKQNDLNVQRSSSAAPPRLRRQATWTTSLRSPQERQESSSPTGSEAPSPPSGGSRSSLKNEKDVNIVRSVSGPGLGLDTLSMLMEKANLAEA